MSGSLAHSPAAIIRQLLIDLGLGTIPSADGEWPIYAYRGPDTPDSTIVVYNTAGVDRGRYMNTGERAKAHGLQIAVRDANAEEGWTKANDIAVALEETIRLNTVIVEDVVGTGSDSYTVYACHITSGPIDAGKDVPAGKRNLFTINFTAVVDQN